MKKTTIRFLSMLFAVMLAVMCCGSALAETVKFETPELMDGHVMVAYQIFKCKIDTNSEGVETISQVSYGTDIDSVRFLEKMNEFHPGKFPAGLKPSTCANRIATLYADSSHRDECAEHVRKAAEYAKTGDGTPLNTVGNGKTTLERGYYLIVDNSTIPVEGNFALNQTVLTYTNPANYRVKTDVPSVEKKVKENTKETPENDIYGTGYNDVADYNIGDEVSFHLIGAIPAKMTEFYTTYKYIFNDTLSKGLTYKTGSIKVYFSSDRKVDNGDSLLTKDIDYKASAVKDSENTEITVTFDDLIASGGQPYKYIIVEYKATLNKDAEIGLPGNPNEVYLTYSNNPNVGHEGETGNTPKDKVIVFTYGIEETKVDNGTPAKALGGAEFILYKMENDTPKYAVLELKSGTTWFVKEWNSSEALATKMTSGTTDGKFTILGVDDGDYLLRETKSPTGYALNETPISIAVDATTSNMAGWDGTDEAKALTYIENVKTNNSTGIVDAADIVNNPIGMLPETGGMGTTLFTLGGLVLMMAAAVMFVLRRREEV